MNLQSLVVVLLRLIALHFLVQCDVQLVPNLALISEQEFGTFGGDTVILIQFGVLAILLAGAAILWMLAVPISHRVTKGLVLEFSLGNMSQTDCYTIAFTLMGLWNISVAFPYALYWSGYLLKTAASMSGATWKEGIRWNDVCREYIRVVLGLIFFVYGRAWAVRLARQPIEQEGLPK